MLVRYKTKESCEQVVSERVTTWLLC